jgi:hypothetical protein
MTPQISISDSLDDKLKALAEPFVDTRESVIARCVDFYVSNLGLTLVKPTMAPASTGPMPFPADLPPDLTFTRPMAIELDGTKFQKKDLYWNNLLFDVVARAAAKLKSMENLKQIIVVNYTEGPGPQEKGYRFIESAGLSVQGQDSNAAWKAIMHVLKAIGMPIDVTFMWENKDKAAHPGKVGRMTFTP